EHVTFNHGVEGSSPSALTNQIKYLFEFSDAGAFARVYATAAKLSRPKDAARSRVPPSYLSRTRQQRLKTWRQRVHRTGS
ncbi:MAG TPA: hypothetical protein VGL45_01920, partial [Bradyrhizobium sp.]